MPVLDQAADRQGFLVVDPFGETDLDERAGDQGRLDQRIEEDRNPMIDLGDGRRRNGSSGHFGSAKSDDLGSVQFDEFLEHGLSQWHAWWEPSARNSTPAGLTIAQVSS